MGIGEALVYGVVQGLTEFLPVSSSGHLVLARELLGGSDEPALELVVLVHAGSLVVILAYFWRDIVSLLTTRRRLIGWLLVGSVPAAAVYKLFQGPVEAAFQEPLLVGLALLVTGTVLLVTERLASDRRSLDEVTWLDAVVVGLAQALALFPGISRSGMTIGSGLARGLNRRSAVTFAFLLGAIAIGGGTLLKAKEIVDGASKPTPAVERGEAGAAPAEGASTHWGPAAAAFAASAVVSLGALAALAFVVRRKRLAGFAIYCYAVGGAVVLAKLTGLW